MYRSQCIKKNITASPFYGEVNKANVERDSLILRYIELRSKLAISVRLNWKLFKQRFDQINSKTSSIRNCRPIRLDFYKTTKIK